MSAFIDPTIVAATVGSGDGMTSYCVGETIKAHTGVWKEKEILSEGRYRNAHSETRDVVITRITPFGLCGVAVWTGKDTMVCSCTSPHLVLQYAVGTEDTA